MVMHFSAGTAPPITTNTSPPLDSSSSSQAGNATVVTATWEQSRERISVWTRIEPSYIQEGFAKIMIRWKRPSYSTAKKRLELGFYSRTVLDGANTAGAFLVGGYIKFPLGHTKPIASATFSGPFSHSPTELPTHEGPKTTPFSASPRRTGVQELLRSKCPCKCSLGTAPGSRTKVQ